jgi:MSHA biogenesis protein MshQ
MTRLFRTLLWLTLALAAGPALAVAYVFPTSMPAGCSGSAGTYTCGTLSLGYNDTITLAAPTPATITVTGNLTTNNARINQGGSASNLTLNVNGTLTAEYQAVLNANVNANVLNGSGTEVVFGGNVTVAGAITLGYRTRVVGNISGASLATGTEVNFGGSVTTSGAVDIGYAASLGGAVTAGSTLRLRGNTPAPQCLRSTSSAAITLDWADRANGGVCCGALGSCTSSCVTNNSGAAMPALCVTPPSPSTPGRFNAFDTATAAGSVSGVIHTKIAGTAFNLAVVAIDTAGTGVASGFTGSVRVELLNASDNSGAMNSSTGCRSSWVVASGTTASTLTFAASDNGRKNIALTVANAWRDARVRISSPATGTATVVGCSSDNFAVRPASLANLSATDATLQTAGTTRPLTNGAATGGNVHKAGQPFTVRATAVNGAATPVTTSNYDGTPAVFVSTCVGAACVGTLGTLTLTPTAAAGVINTPTASYSEAGAFTLQLVDSNFASVDASDGSTPAEMSVTSAAVTVGRFVPDHFELELLTTPVLRTFNSSICTPRSFTYLGQPFGYATAAQATVLARNAAGATTVNYPDAKLSALVRSQTYTPLLGATPGLDSSGATLPGITPHGNGTATLAAQTNDLLSMVRPTTAPVAPFNAAISLAWSVTDSSETGTGNGSITTTTPLSMANIGFDRGNEFRFGVLKLGSAYGSELINLAVPLELQYWNGNSFVTNADDACTSLPTSSLALGPYRGNLAACETAPGSPSVVFTGGRGLLRMLPPGAGNAGSVDATLNLGVVAAGQQCPAVGVAASPAVTAGLPWLQGKRAAAATYNQNPVARISFGQYRSPLIHLREMY